MEDTFDPIDIPAPKLMDGGEVKHKISLAFITANGATHFIKNFESKLFFESMYRMMLWYDTHKCDALRLEHKMKLDGGKDDDVYLTPMVLECPTEWRISLEDKLETISSR